ncbi:unnamed protein product, partial [Staurois parvus]
SAVTLTECQRRFLRGCHQCHLSVYISASSQCSSMPPISATSAYHATYQCPSELPFNVTSVPVSATYQCASQCHLSVLPISATYQCCQC